MFRIVFFLFIFVLSLFAENIIIGKFDRVDLPQLKLENIKAKIDSGAKTSSLHCSYIKQSDENTIIFEVLDESHKKFSKKRYILPIQRIAKVRSSNGSIEKRFVILLKTVIFDKEFEVEYTLRNRMKMNFPILLGREFLQNDFLIDVNKKYLSYSKKTIK